MTNALLPFPTHDLGNGCLFHEARLPPELLWSDTTFPEVWNLKPAERHWIMMHGKPVQTPRFQQAYEVDYFYTGRTNKALPLPAILRPVFDWARAEIDPRLNGVLLNWYDAEFRHYIGAHHDNTRNMVRGSGIVTVSFGAARTFRLTRGAGAEREVRDFLAESGTVFVMPWDTNLAWKHEVPHFTRHRGCRISVTLRALKVGPENSIEMPTTKTFFQKM